MPLEEVKVGWFARNAALISLIMTLTVIVFTVGVNWAIMQEREYINNKVNEITKQQNDRYERILLELGRLQGNK